MSRIVPWVALLLWLVTACGGDQEDATQPPSGGRPQLVLPGSPAGLMESQLPAKKHQTWIHGSYTMCLDEPGEVKVNSVEFQSGDLEIAEWVLRPKPGSRRQGPRR